MTLLQKLKNIAWKARLKRYPYLKYSKHSFSIDGEDMVLNAFYVGKEDYSGFYVDIGAHHPFRFSNTAFFYLQGWSGVNIDASPKFIKTFSNYRARDINLNVGIASKEGELLYHEFEESAYNGFDRDLSDYRENELGLKIMNKTLISVRTLESVLDANLPEKTKIDFFSIDVEGLDMDVLKSNNWIKYRPDFILIEGEVDFDNIHDNEIYKYLWEKQYELVARTRGSFIFRSKSV